jgi:hypothetical protein
VEPVRSSCRSPTSAAKPCKRVRGEIEALPTPDPQPPAPAHAAHSDAEGWEGPGLVHVRRLTMTTGARRGHARGLDARWPRGAGDLEFRLPMAVATTMCARSRASSGWRSHVSVVHGCCDSNGQPILRIKPSAVRGRRLATPDCLDHRIGAKADGIRREMRRSGDHGSWLGRSWAGGRQSIFYRDRPLLIAASGRQPALRVVERQAIVTNSDCSTRSGHLQPHVHGDRVSPHEPAASYLYAENTSGHQWCFEGNRMDGIMDADSRRFGGQTLLALPYHERQFIVMRKGPGRLPRIDSTPSAQNANDEADPDDSGAANARDGEVAPRSVGAQLGMAAGWANRTMGRVYDGTRREYRRLKERIGDIDFIDVGFDEVSDIRFPVGHPRRRVVYVGHPLVPAVYRPMADFHRYLFQQRVVEAIQMLRALGATELDIEHVTGRSSVAAIEEGRQSLSGLSATWSSVRRRERSQQVLAHFEYPVMISHPQVSEDLIWAVQEPLWMEIAEGRLTRGLTSFTLEIRDVDDFGVRKSVAVAAMWSGLSLGGNFDEHQDTVWRLKGRFSPIS